MNSLKGGSFPQIAISVCKLCRAAVESGRKHNHLKSSELLEDPASPSVSTPSCRSATERQATCFYRLLRGSRSVGVSKVSINYHYFSLVRLYSSEERGRID